MQQTRLLLVEGKQDWHVFDHVCYAHGIMINPDHTPNPVFAVKPQDGIEHLRDVLKVSLKGSALTHIGVVVDADQIPEDTRVSGRWSSIRDLFVAAGYDCPERPEAAGLILRQKDRPTVGLWVMPDNLSPGKLESFMSALVPSDSALWTWAQTSVNSAPACEERFEDKDREKALVHTYLAVQKQPGTAMGSAVRKHYFDAQAELAIRFVTWIRNLFELNAQ